MDFLSAARPSFFQIGTWAVGTLFSNCLLQRPFFGSSKNQEPAFSLSPNRSIILIMYVVNEVPITSRVTKPISFLLLRVPQVKRNKGR